MKMVKLALSLLCALSVVGCGVAGPESRSTPDQSAFNDGQAAVYGVTLLRSHDTDPSDLVAFIQANWFAMDEIAVQQGLMTSYEVFAGPRREQDAWNVMVVVGFPTAGGYNDIADEFQAIRSAHEPVAVNGMTELNDFGSFMSSQTLMAPPGQ